MVPGRHGLPKGVRVLAIHEGEESRAPYPSASGRKSSASEFMQ